MNLTARNDYSEARLSLEMNLYTGAWPIWVYGIILVGIFLLISVGYLGYKKIKYYKKQKNIE